MDQDGRDRLSGDVEFDETYVGGKEEGVFGRARGKRGTDCYRLRARPRLATMGRIRLARLPDASALAIADFLENSVESGSVIICDNWTSYQPAFEELASRGLHYTVKSTTLARTDAKAHVIHPHVHRVASLLKRWLLGTHQELRSKDPISTPISTRFTFRFNRQGTPATVDSSSGASVCVPFDTPPMTREEIGRRRARPKSPLTWFMGRASKSGISNKTG